MREIKFRAWETIFTKDGSDKGIMKGDIVYQNGVWVTDEISLNNILAKNNHKIMQYTGLKDKNGVEIYEGDIVDDKFNKGQLHEVYYSNEKACFMAKSINSKSNINTDMPISVSPSTFTEGEVTGNIYENPELLNN